MKNKNFTLQKLFGKTVLLFLALSLTGNLNAQCSAGFTYTVMPNGQVFFSSTATGLGINPMYSWNFGDGNNGFGINTSHIYSSPGVMYVTHTVTDSLGCYSSAVDSVLITNATCKASVGFMMHQDSLMPLTWNAYAYYQPNIVSATWSWGDGSTSNGLYPSHTYTAPGNYYICVTVSVSCGDTATYCHNSTIFRMQEGASQMIQVNVKNPQSITTGLKTQSSSLARAQLFPSPAADKVSLSVYSEASTSYKIDLYTVTGKLVMSDVLRTEPGNTVKELNIASLESGLYFLSLSNAADHKTIRLIKE